EHGGRVAFFDADRGLLVARHKGHDDEITDIAFSPDSRYVVSAGLDGAVVLWDAQSGQVLRTYFSHRPGKLSYSDEQVLFADYASFVNNDKILTGGSDHELHLIPLFGVDSTDEFNPDLTLAASSFAEKWKGNQRKNETDELRKGN